MQLVNNINVCSVWDSGGNGSIRVVFDKGHEGGEKNFIPCHFASEELRGARGYSGNMWVGSDEKGDEKRGI